MDPLQQQLAGLLFFAFLFNTAASFLVAYIAKEKGRSAAAFFFVSFCTTFVIGLLVTIAIPSKSPTPLANGESGRFAESPDGLLFKCTFCAEWVKAEATICRHCGKEISNEIAKQRQTDLIARARAIDNENIRLERLSENREISRKLRAKGLKSPLFLISAAGIVVAVIGALLLNLIVSNQQVEARIAKENDWTAAVDACYDIRYRGDSASYDQESKELTIITEYSEYSTRFVDCFGFRIAEDGRLLSDVLYSAMEGQAINDPVSLLFGNRNVTATIIGSPGDQQLKIQISQQR